MLGPRLVVVPVGTPTWALGVGAAAPAAASTLTGVLAADDLRVLPYRWHRTISTSERWASDGGNLVVLEGVRDTGVVAGSGTLLTTAAVTLSIADRDGTVHVAGAVMTPVAGVAGNYAWRQPAGLLLVTGGRYVLTATITVGPDSRAIATDLEVAPYHGEV